MSSSRCKFKKEGADIIEENETLVLCAVVIPDATYFGMRKTALKV